MVSLLALFCEDSAYTPCQGDTLCSVHNMSGMTLCCILGNPGAVRGGGKKIGAKKSQEQGEELFSSFLGRRKVKNEEKSSSPRS